MAILEELQKFGIFTGPSEIRWRAPNREAAIEMDERYKALKARTEVLGFLFRKGNSPDGISDEMTDQITAMINCMPISPELCNLDHRHGFAIGVTGFCWKCCHALLCSKEPDLWN